MAKRELSRANTAQADAKLIARYARARQSALGTPPPRQIRTLPALLRRVEPRRERPRMEHNRLDTADPATTGSIPSVLATLEQALQATRDTIRQHLDNQPDLKQRREVLQSIPGVGEATAAWLLSVLSDHYGFTHAKQVVAHLGLAPVIGQSGKWAGQTRRSNSCTGRSSLP